jgi:hypothetical protein
MPLNIPFWSQEIPAVALVCTRTKNGGKRGHREKKYVSNERMVRVQVVVTHIFAPKYKKTASWRKMELQTYLLRWIIECFLAQRAAIRTGCRTDGLQRVVAVSSCRPHVGWRERRCVEARNILDTHKRIYSSGALSGA